MKIVVSAGPTREKIDAVRFLTNYSSGKMGYALAQAARELEWETVLVSGPVSLPVPAGVRCVRVESAAEMADAVKREFQDAQICIMAAAVADYRPKTVFSGKRKKTPGDLVLTLERTEDILLSLGKIKQPRQKLIGFSAETEDLLKNAAGKLERKNLDWIVANDVSNRRIGFGSDENAVTLLSADGRKITFPSAPKLEIARKILQTILG